MTIRAASALLLTVTTAAAQTTQEQRMAEYARTHPPRESVGLVPLTDGEGLYPGGGNVPPAAHAKAGAAIGARIAPIGGAIVFLSVGMSNTSQESQAFATALAEEPEVNPLLRFVNGAQGGQSAEKTTDAAAPYWRVVDERLAKAGHTADQVQIVWLKQANIAPTKPFPAEARRLESDLRKIIAILHARFPNLKLVYLSSRIYAGWARSPLNPEPHAYESAQAARWIVGGQIAGEADLNFDPARGPVRAPWLAWGPYLWADGIRMRGDGLSWGQADLAADGTHPSAQGAAKVARLLVDFFKSGDSARPWFLGEKDKTRLTIRVTDETGKPIWTRLEVYGPEGKRRQPPEAILDHRSRFAREEPGYRSSFVVNGATTLTVKPGTYKIIAEHGLEYERAERRVAAAGAAATADIQLKPWIRANRRGWWSGDMHVHRPPEIVEALARAEDLNLSVVFTMWNRQNLWAGKTIPKDPVIRYSPRHLALLMNAEDERFGGAWMLHSIPEPLPLAETARFYPLGLKFIAAARATRKPGALFPWFDSEKLIWWETPAVMALNPPDSAGVLHNHFHQYGMMENEAWGRPRDAARFPGRDGFAGYTNSLYYRYLNLGFRLPATAGSASGVLPNPAGYNRMYARLNGPFTAENWYKAVKEGKSFATNGPMLFFEARQAGGRVKGSVEVVSRDPLTVIELVANGEVVERFSPPPSARSFRARFDLASGKYSWIAARAFAQNDRTVRMAHTSPVYLEGKWDATGDARFFEDWMNGLIAQTEADPKRFATPAERDEVLEAYRRARAFYAARR